MFKKRKAEIALEEIMTVVLAVALLFLILNMFGDNIAKMLHNSTYQKAMRGEYKKTNFESFNKNPTKTQLNVQIAADQASLAKIHGMARWDVEKYGRMDKSQMSDGQLTALAKALTIFAMSGDTDPTNELNTNFIEGTNISFDEIKRNHFIEIKFVKPPLYTKIPNKNMGRKEYYWSTEKKYNTDINFDTKEEQKRVQNINAINKCFNNNS